MNAPLEIRLTPENLDEGAPEERATFGQLVISSGNLLLTEGFDGHLDGYRPGPFVAGYFLAEWLAWNWWRLRWEPPRRNADDWWFAHRLTAIGEGYQWPSLTIFSDGHRIALESERSAPTAQPFRYNGAPPLIITAASFEAAVDTFVAQMLERVRDLGETNLARNWRDVLAERADTATAELRRLEALLGHEPDADDPTVIEALVRDGQKLGKLAIDEVAAQFAERDPSSWLHAQDYHDLARSLGYEGRVADAVSLDVEAHNPDATTEPWKVGKGLASKVRANAGLQGGAVSDQMLAEMAGVSKGALSSNGKHGEDFSFGLRSGPVRWRAVFRGQRKTSRRFDLARMIGDRLLSDEADRLYPVTDAFTWRQQAQRSFAVELLAPIELVEERLNGDYSLECQHDVADQFQVSPMAINSLLKNHHRIARDEPFLDVDRMAA